MKPTQSHASKPYTVWTEAMLIMYYKRLAIHPDRIAARAQRLEQLEQRQRALDRLRTEKGLRKASLALSPESQENNFAYDAKAKEAKYKAQSQQLWLQIQKEQLEKAKLFVDRKRLTHMAFRQYLFEMTIVTVIITVIILVGVNV